jgi:hypothetical protein
MHGSALLFGRLVFLLFEYLVRKQTNSTINLLAMHRSVK